MNRNINGHNNTQMKNIKQSLESQHLQGFDNRESLFIKESDLRMMNGSVVIQSPSPQYLQYANQPLSMIERNGDQLSDFSPSRFNT